MTIRHILSKIWQGKELTVDEFLLILEDAENPQIMEIADEIKLLKEKVVSVNEAEEQIKNIKRRKIVSPC